MSYLCNKAVKMCLRILFIKFSLFKVWEIMCVMLVSRQWECNKSRNDFRLSSSWLRTIGGSYRKKSIYGSFMAPILHEAISENYLMTTLCKSVQHSIDGLFTQWRLSCVLIIRFMYARKKLNEYDRADNLYANQIWVRNYKSNVILSPYRTI